MKSILISTNSIKGLYSFRKEVVENIINNNYKVVIIGPKSDRDSKFTELGIEIKHIEIQRRGKNILHDLKLLFIYIRLFKNLKPDIVLTYTIKPNIYSSIACRVLKIPYLVNITGLGEGVQRNKYLRLLTLKLYEIALKNAATVFFQNQNNLDYFLDNNIVKENQITLIPGSGVNLNKFKFIEYPKENTKIRFLFIGRIMKSKGIEELLKAIEIIQEQHKNITFDIVGPFEENYEEILNEYQQQGMLNFYGQQNEVRRFIEKAHAIINPSYHEGMSNVLLEAAASGRPVLASEVPGCIETFDEDISGIGFKAKDTDSLVFSINRFLNKTHDEKVEMGIKGREKIEREFNREIIVNTYMKKIKRTLED